jgi:hypothetical protein
MKLLIINLIFLLSYCSSEEKIEKFADEIKCGGWQSIKCPEDYHCIQDPIKLDQYGSCKKF